VRGISNVPAKSGKHCVRGRNAQFIPVNTGVGQASWEVLDEKVTKGPACGISMVKPMVRSCKPIC